jgi:uncharacterized RDD family membrane protein YckC
VQQENPYSAPLAVVEDARAIDESALGGRGERLVAVIVDTIIQLVALLLVSVPVLFAVGFKAIGEWAIRNQGGPPWWFGFVFAGLGFVLFLLIQGYPLATSGQTWGKRMLKLRIVDLEGRKPDFARLIGLRYAVGWAIGLIPLLGPMYSLVDALFVFRDDRRCIHDHIAGTRVVVAR